MINDKIIIVKIATALVVAFILLACMASAYAEKLQAMKIDCNPVFSPDGRYLVFERNHPAYSFTEIVVYNIQTESSATITGRVFDLAWRDESMFAAAGLVDVSIFKADGAVIQSACRQGAGQKNTGSEWLDAGNLGWTNDGLVFDTIDTDSTVRSWILNEKIGKFRMTGSNDNINNQFSLRHNTSAKTDRRELIVDNRGRLILKRNGPDVLLRLGSATMPVFSRNSSQIVLVGNAGDSLLSDLTKPKGDLPWQNIYVLNRDGSGLRRITKMGGIQPVFHPSINGLAFVTPNGAIGWSDINGLDYSILITHPDSTNRLRWHSNGRWLLAQVVANGQASWQMMRPPSGRLSRYTPPIDIPGPGHVFLSNSGRRLVVINNGPTSAEITIVTQTETKTIAIFYSSRSGNMALPSACWSDDEQQIAVSIAGGISLINASSGEVTTITSKLY